MEPIVKSHEREAARVNLRKMLETKKRGDHIAAKEIADATGFEDWRSFGDTIRKWALSAGFALVPIVNEGWRIGLADDHVTVASKQRRSVRRKLAKASSVLVSTPVTELSEHGVRRHEREMLAVARLKTIADADDKAIRKDFALDSGRVPLRIKSGK